MNQVTRTVGLVLIIAFGINTASLAQKPDALSVDALRAKFNSAYNAKKYRQATKFGKELTKRFPSSTTYFYNLACVYALDEKTISASRALKQAAKNGFSDFTLATNDPDLVSIRTDPGYMEVIKLIRKNQDEGVVALDAAMADSPPYIWVPPGHDAHGAAPLIVALHGYGTSAEDIAGAWQPSAQEFGAILLAPRAVKKVNDHGYSWNNFAEANAIVTKAIEQVKKKYRIDNRRVVLTGFSQGGFMTYEIGLRHPEWFCGLVPIAGQYADSIHGAAHASRDELPRVFIMVGSKDRALDSNRKASNDLKAAGLSVKLNVYDGVGHSVPPNHQAEFRKALHFVWDR